MTLILGAIMFAPLVFALLGRKDASDTAMSVAVLVLALGIIVAGVMFVASLVAS